MTDQERVRLESHRNVRRLKRLLRPLPRRSNIHRYPVLKWFARSARRRSYLWSFREENAIPAIYGGAVVAMLPIFGLQLVTAFALSLVMRANLVIFASLQMITNYATAVPLYFAAYKLGSGILSSFGIATDSVPVSTVYEGSTLNLVTQGIKATALGGTIIGLLIGFVLAVVYRMVFRSFRLEHNLLGMRRRTQKTANGAVGPS